MHKDAGTARRGDLQQAFGASHWLLRRAAVFALLAALLVLVPSWYMLEVYDRVLGSRNPTTLAMLTVLVGGAYLVMELLDWTAGVLLVQAGVQVERRLAPRTFDVCFSQALRTGRGADLQPLDDLRAIREFLSGAAVRAALELPVAVVLLAVLFAVHPLLGWVAGGAALVQVGIAAMTERSTQPGLVRAAAAARQAQKYSDAALRNADSVAAMGMLPALQARWQAHQDAFVLLQGAASAAAGRWQAAARMVQAASASALLGLAAWLLLRDQLGAHAGWLVVASILGGRVLAPIAALVSQWRSVVTAREAWQRLDALLAALPATPPAMPLPKPAGRLVADNLVVTPPGSGTPLLKGVSLAVAPGEAVAVIGPSGSGKTTLARAVTGLWPSVGGKARLDGADVFAWDKAELGAHVGYLPQGVELFDGSVAENIARFGPPDGEKVEAAARCAGLHEWITSLPHGYDTPVGVAGARLSGGQRQRVALARALYGAPALLVLDEPNASLDAAGDAALAGAIGAAKAQGCAVLVITHRTGVLAACDRMLVLADGQVQAWGTRDDVLAALEAAAGPRTAPPARPRPQQPELAQ